MLLAALTAQLSSPYKRPPSSSAFPSNYSFKEILNFKKICDDALKTNNNKTQALTKTGSRCLENVIPLTQKFQGFSFKGM